MAASRQRLDVLARQLDAGPVLEQAAQLALSPTAGQDTEARMLELMEQTEPYAVPLPEKLRPDGPWQVYR